MAELTLIIGNRNYSSWSLRAWLALRVANIDFDEVLVPLDQPDTSARIRSFSAAGCVPVLRHGGLTVWDSLAICEYVSELAPDPGLWPAGSGARAVARSVCAEMHSGFKVLREALPMNIRAHRPGITVSVETRADIDRICAIWSDCLKQYGEGGPFLFGRFTVADAMFAPVVTRFHSYGVTVDHQAQRYMEAVRSLPAMMEWATAAAAEPWVLEAEEIGAG
jgi:glutathione S-transferase